MKKAKLLLAACLCVFVSHSHFLQAQNVGPAPDWNWVQTFGNSELDLGKEVVCSPAGDMYVTGYFNGQISVNNQVFSSYGLYAAFVVKLDPSGQVQWVKTLETDALAGETVGQVIALDNNGNVIVSGYFRSGALKLGNLTFPVASSIDLFVVSYDSSGNLLW
ncbi:MAG: hypothetical protein KDD04_11695, partial [Sinomicrobium sp.]|nr:hypothetical protein [Sinomicrobium sp.]